MDFWLINVKVETSYTTQDAWINGTTTQLMALEVIAGQFKQILPLSQFNPRITPLPIIDGKGALLLPGLIEKHCHLDKSKLGTPWQPVTPAASLVERFESEIPQLDALALPITKRAQELINAEIKHGATSFRSHIDIEPMTDLRYFNAIHDYIANAPFATELVAFPQHGLLHSHASALLEQVL